MVEFEESARAYFNGCLPALIKPSHFALGHDHENKIRQARIAIASHILFV